MNAYQIYNFLFPVEFKNPFFSVHVRGKENVTYLQDE